MQKGQIVQTRRNVSSQIVPGKATWEDAVRANADVIAQAESESVRFVKDVAAAYPAPAHVSYSGGKDSLVTLLVVRKATRESPAALCRYRS